MIVYGVALVLNVSWVCVGAELVGDLDPAILNGWFMSISAPICKGMTEGRIREVFETLASDFR